VNTEAVAKLFAPLVSKARGRDHEHAGIVPAMEKFRNDQTGLHRLAKADGVRDEQPARVAPGDSQRRLQLKRHQGEIRACCRTERRGRGGRVRQCAPRDVTPA
jgi:hypothetical protein